MYCVTYTVVVPACVLNPIPRLEENVSVAGVVDAVCVGI
jgi:hypothetical protein